MPRIHQGVAFQGLVQGLARPRLIARGMKYTLIHVAYHPGRARTEVARQLIMHMTAEKTKKRFPNLEASFELLGYDAPATIDVEMVDGRKKRLLAEHYSTKEMQDQGRRGNPAPSVCNRPFIPQKGNISHCPG
eukprot:g16847.t1